MTKDVQALLQDLSKDIWADLQKIITDEVGDLSDTDLLALKAEQDNVLAKVAQGDEFGWECYENYCNLLVLRYKRRVTKQWHKEFLERMGKGIVELLWKVAKVKLGG